MRSAGAGWAPGAGLGLLLALGYALQTAGLERTTVSSTGFITGLYVVFTPLLAFALFGTRSARRLAGVGLSTVGLRSSRASTGTLTGDALVLAGSAAYSLQIVLMEALRAALRPARLHAGGDARGLRRVRGGRGGGRQVEAPRGWTVWGALLVTGVFAGALAFLVQTWAQRRTSATRTALAFAMEPVFAAAFGFWLAGDRLGAVGVGRLPR